MDGRDQFHGPNAGYVAELYDRYLDDPRTVDAATRATFDGWRRDLSAAPARDPSAAPVSVDRRPDLAGAAAAAELAQNIRRFGHRLAQLDPLGAPPPGDPHLEPVRLGLIEPDLRRLPAGVVDGPVTVGAGSAAEALAALRAIYCATTGYELGHIQAPEEREWLDDAIEAGRYRPPHEAIDERALFARLTEVAAFERFLHRAYPGQTRFSIEGIGMLIPMLDEMIACAGDSGTRTILLGMAHRGRLNVLAHVLGKPYQRILAEFEGRVASWRRAPSDGADDGWAGDVKYHAGGERALPARSPIGVVKVILAPNPSHLEFVNPIVEGMARAADEDRHRLGAPHQDEIASMPVLIHGDAAFPGQGVVAETLNLSRLPGYRTGGTLHIIANNQLGFTTNPIESRSTLYASDLAKGFEIPIVHVNADDPIACVAAARLAVAYRNEFRKDFLIDLIGYRRWGHNEGDEPSFTQPRIYQAVADHPTVRQLYAADLVGRGVLAPDEPDVALQAGLDRFQRLREAVQAEPAEPIEPPEPQAPPDDRAGEVATAVSADRLRELGAALTRFPEDFTVNPKLERAIQRRRAIVDRDDTPIDWGYAESLAFATILADGTPIRLTGQDALRGTFSQRHLAYFDPRTGARHTPLMHLPGVAVSFDARNSPLTETATLGFEYGYSVQAPDTLVIWEAQYGDFVNGAQVIVDEWLVSAQAKWGLRSGLVVLLPHGWEGQGPDHSSGRLERFLQLAAEDNIRVANCTTAAQFFHLLRRQAGLLDRQPRPLIVMTPKSLLRHPLAEARLADLAAGRFHPVLDDPETVDRAADVRRVIFCSGKLWADLVGDRQRADAAALAIVRIEELYPFPSAEVADILARYERATEIVWAQEEPRSMGAWSFVAPRLRDLLDGDRRLRYIGRPEQASPAEGWAHVHAAEQRRIVAAALEGVPSYAS